MSRKRSVSREEVKDLGDMIDKYKQDRNIRTDTPIPPPVRVIKEGFGEVKPKAPLVTFTRCNICGDVINQKDPVSAVFGPDDLEVYEHLSCNNLSLNNPNIISILTFLKNIPTKNSIEKASLLEDIRKFIRGLADE